MIHKIFIFITLIYTNIYIASASAPAVNCVWLPWCADTSKVDVKAPSSVNNLWIEVVSSLISQLIQFVAAFAVFALIISWIMYLLSGWEEEKAKKAKTWIIWSLVWVVVSISAWWIINILNNLKID